jgi:hypothetical protein
MPTFTITQEKNNEKEKILKDRYFEEGIVIKHPGYKNPPF